ncbi:MAG: ABC transporter permease [Deltaproteobacteria bacterium]|nr:ABC transporter permease [Deltaproteobacteria bacterium]
MRVTWAIYKRELAAHFYTPLAYVILVVFLLWNGGTFLLLLQQFAANPEISGTRGPMQLLFGGSILYFLPILLFCPALTMRAFAEERRSGTFESLMTAPVRDIEVVLGKYFSALTVYVVLWAPTILYAMVLRKFGPIDWGALGASYFGTFLLGAALISLGVLASAMARSQVTAFVLAFALTSGLFLAGLGKYVFESEAQQAFFSYLNQWEHMEEFAVGVVDSRRVFFYVSIAAVALFQTTRVLQLRKGVQ